MNRRKLTMVAATAAMLVLILDSRCAMTAASEGLDLCIRTVIPSLFPFFLVSILLTQTVSDWKLLRPVGKLFRIPAGAEALLITGLLGGYPVGAQTVAQACRRGELSRKVGNRMLGFCSQAGPAFIFGIAGGFFPSAWFGWLLWAVQLFSAWGVSVFLKPTGNGSVSPGDAQGHSISDALRKSLRIMAEVCGWIVIFRVILGFLSRWFLWMLPETLRVLTAGLLELANGCCELGSVSSLPLRFTLCAGMLNFGGVCVAMQTLSVTEGLDFRYYLTGKLIQGFLAVGISILLFFSELAVYPLVLLGFIPVAGLFRKKGGNTVAVGV